MKNGNVKEQRKRRRKMQKIVPRAPTEYLLIDGNYSYYPYAFCKRKQGYLTLGIATTHRCECRNCEQYERIFIL